MAAALETLPPGETYRWISMGYTDDNWDSVDLGLDEVGPPDLNEFMFPGAGPYLKQFPSGETALAYNTGGYQVIRLGDARARVFGNPQGFLPKKGYWGTLEIIGPREVVAAMHTTGAIMIGVLHLNRTIDAKRIHPSHHGLPFSNDDDHLFIGSDSQAQARIWVGRHGDDVIVNVERRDNSVTDNDQIDLYLADSSGSHTVHSTLMRGRSTCSNHGAGVDRVSSPSHDGQAWQVRLPLRYLGPGTEITTPRRHVAQRRHGQRCRDH